MDDREAYLIGLMCGRGHLFTRDKKVIIEFAHKNKEIQGIAHCPKCGDLATTKKLNNDEGDLFCKSCNFKVNKSEKMTYEQKESTLFSIKNTIIPFLKSRFKSDFEVVGNDHMTFLIITFKHNPQNFDMLKKLFIGSTSFDSFKIPKEIYSSSKENKIEFINGFLDTAGFFNSGGWLNREGRNGNGRMRAYFQIVRNWKMPVLICNFLKSEFSLPIHTIDWGHPNIRDSKMEDYYNSNHMSWSREHQVKFFPEYYEQFKIRVKHKQEMFDELKNHNKRVSFDNNDDCNPPKSIGKGKLKPYHFGEKDKRIPNQIRKHHDSYWQVCNNIGCTFSNKNISKCKNKEICYLTGKDSEMDGKLINEKFHKIRKELTNKIIEKNNNEFNKKEIKLDKKKKTNPEQQLYQPISIWFKDYLEYKGFRGVKVHDTSAYYLDKFVIQNDLHKEFDFCDKFKIKPDIVGFFSNSKIGFVEVKIGELTLKDIGQLLGYCLVALPEVAIILSPKQPSINLIKILKANHSLLNYEGYKRIKIGVWKNNKCELLEF
ncbi:MAG: hypothetical protein ABH873_07945 [Candidatus Firestonebacteria bacterium]